MKSWQDERDIWGLTRPEVFVWKPGLLTEQDIRRIKEIVFGV
jgi:hypothetical protein